ncbi:YbhB/YbcL family Raf kinase inhibitor-like protein [Patescibacteria group bacterium]|nr:YbhB/YbcL family Raf kinase inhibitor-like protein [Patescibacteria group bacterium]
MTMTSSVFEHGALIPIKYTCDGENMNPPLVFSDIPENAISLVLIMEDPDVPKSIRSDGMWDHWVVFNIPPSVTSLEENEQPSGVAGKGTTENLHYKGPCPPAQHRYYFRLFALDTLLDLPEGSIKLDVLEAMEGHVLAEAKLMGRYDRPVNDDS